MSEATDNLKFAIAKSIASADNENYLIQFSIAEGNAVLADIEQLQAKIEGLGGDKRRLKAALNKYGKHLKEPECEIYWRRGEYIATQIPCTCGLDQALKG